MAKITRFEDIIAWRKARDLVGKIYGVSFTKAGSTDYSLQDQIRRASVSVMSNIAEGYGRQTGKDFIKFLYFALGSAAEVQSQLYIAYDLGYLDEQRFKELYELTSECAKIIRGLIKSL
ncbi:MAG: four helix bundle protein [Bacteroidota bacterium]